MGKDNKYKFVFAGGGTGGHLYPAVAVAEKIKELKPEAEIMFIGTKSKIEGTVVPKLGYKFKPIWIKGFARKLTLENILFPVKLVISMGQSLMINSSFKPKVAIGSGGYVSGPAIWGASVLGAKVILLEQNSFPGVTTRMLEKKAETIHITFEESIKYFREKEKLRMTGNPVRSSLVLFSREEALKKFGLKTNYKTIVIIGGSLGAASINKTMGAIAGQLEANNVQVIWQTGKNYYEIYKNLNSEKIKVMPFIDDMAAAYSAADLVIARAGATTIAELTSLGVAAILIPSPNVAANHQYYNAKSLSDKDAAVLLMDNKMDSDLLGAVLENVNNQAKLAELKTNVKKFGKPDASLIIAKNAIELAESV